MSPLMALCLSVILLSCSATVELSARFLAWSANLCVTNKGKCQHFEKKKGSQLCRAGAEGKEHWDVECRENLSCCSALRNDSGRSPVQLVSHSYSYDKRGGSGLAVCGAGADMRDPFLWSHPRSFLPTTRQRCKRVEEEDETEL